MDVTLIPTRKTQSPQCCRGALERGLETHLTTEYLSLEYAHADGSKGRFHFCPDHPPQFTKLSHGQLIFAREWGRADLYAVGTLAGYLGPERSDELEAERARQEAAGRATVWANARGKALCGDPGHYEREQELRRGAQGVEGGEIVEIEGQLFKVRLVGWRFNDGIHFDPEGR